MQETANEVPYCIQLIRKQASMFSYSLFNREQRARIQCKDEADKWERTPVAPIEAASDLIYLKVHRSTMQQILLIFSCFLNNKDYLLSKRCFMFSARMIKQITHFP